MTAKWGCCAFLVVSLALLAGCRAPVPDLKPANTPDKLVEPPQEARYDTPGYPKQVFDPAVDPTKTLENAKGVGGPSRSGSSGGMGGLPGR